MKASILILAWLVSGSLSAGSLLILDPGHGGSNPGVRAGDVNEADLVLEIAQETQAQLKVMGIDTALTRSGNQDLSLSQRVALANVSGARAFLSLHLNHSPSPYAKGVRIFIAKPGSSIAKDEPSPWNLAASARAEEARPLALSLAKALSPSENQKISVQAMNLAIFKGLNLPSVVIELGFLSHAETLENFKNSDYRKALAGRLAAGIKAWAAAAVPASPASVPAGLSPTVGAKP